MNHRLVTVTMAAVIAAGSLITAGQPAWANPSLEKKIENIQSERSDTQLELESAEGELARVQQEQEALEKEIRAIDDQVADTNRDIRRKQKEIDEVHVHIEQLKEELRVLEARIAERDELLKDRARSMYKNGGSINYLEVLLGAKSFGDFIDRVSALSIIAKQDRNILEAHIEDQRMVEETKGLVEAELQKLEGHLVELESLMNVLEGQRNQKDKLMESLEKQKEELHSHMMELEEANDILAAQERAMKQELAAYEERQRQRQLELERQRQKGGNHSAPSETVEGQFMRPTTGSLTSPFGMRWGRLHAGIDIGKNGRTGDVPVVAVEGGTVIRSYYSSTYGNTVMISHNVDGRVITSLYAHLENRNVSDGERVTKGQLLGYMGNTGRSFGAHLHFEIHEGPWTENKRYAVNPLKYIPN